MQPPVPRATTAGQRQTTGVGRVSGVRPGPRASVGGRIGGGSRNRRAVGWRNRDIIRATAIVLAVYLAVKLFWIASSLFFVVFLGMLFGIAVSAGVDQLQRFRIPRGVGAATIVLGFVGLLVGFGAWVAPTLREQGGELRVKLPEAADRVQEWVKKRQSGVLGLLVTETQSATPAPAVTPPAVPAVRAPQIPADSDAAGASGIQSKLRERLSGMSRYLFPFITSTVEVLGGLLIILFLAIYFAAEPELYRRGLLSFLPAKRRARGVVMMDRIATVLRKWLITQLIAMATIGIVTTTVLLIFRVKAALALGVLAGLFEFIPTVGPILSALPGVAMGFLDSPEKAGYLALAYWGIQFLEGHILIPLLMKEGLRIPPALTVIVQALLTIIFGFIGLMVAVPLLATVIVIFQMLYLEKLPVEGTWTYPVFAADLDEPIDDAHGAHS